MNEHFDYLDRMVREGVVSVSMAIKAKVVWLIASAAVGDRVLPIPAAAAFQGGPMEYHWLVGPHRLSVTIPNDANGFLGTCIWTYLNIETGEIGETGGGWGEWAVEYNPEWFPPGLAQVLTRIADKHCELCNEDKRCTHSS